MIIVADVFR